MVGVRLGRIFGIPLEVRYSFLLLVVLAYYYGVYQGAPGLVMALLGLLCLSVLLHEIAHALVARWLGVPAVRIDLNLFGGSVKLARLPRGPRDEMLIALAGPAMSLIVAGAGELIYQGSGARIAAYFVGMNLYLGLFNLLPILPLDGGRVLRAMMTGALGLERATAAAVNVARVGCVVGAVIAPLVGQPAAIVFAVLFFFSAGNELKVVQRLRAVDTEQLGLDGAGVVPAEVEILDAQGRPARGGAQLGGTYVIEEHRSGDERRWVVRGEDGAVLLVTDTPLA